MPFMQWLVLLALVLSMAITFALFAAIVWYLSQPTNDTPIVNRSSARKRRSPVSPYVSVQCYFTLTERMIFNNRAMPGSIGYGVRVAVPSRFARLTSFDDPYRNDFHSLIQLHGSFIISMK